MTKRGILRAGLWALAVVVLFVGAAAGFALCLRHKFNPAPPSNDFPKPVNALEAQQQDIEQFSRLLAMDRAFSPAARAEANRQIAELKSEQAPLDRERFVRRCTGGPKDPNHRWNSFGAVFTDVRRPNGATNKLSVHFSTLCSICAPLGH